MVFTTIAGLYLLGFILPLLILYLIKAKPQELTVPSLLFFMSEKKVKKYNALFQKLLVRTLFFLQLLFIILIALAAADPVIQIPQNAYGLNTVAIVDVSASMGTKDTTITRMESNKDELLSLIKGKTSVILAEQTPIVLAQNVSARRARALISHLEPKEVGTRLDSALLLANDLLGEERGTIILYSDFLLTADEDLLAAKKIAEANDKRVLFVETGVPVDNLGFTQLHVNRGTAEAFIKNFGKRAQTVDVKLITDGLEKQQTRVDIEPDSIERISFDILTGKTRLDIVQKDRLTTDDTLYLVNPYSSAVNILFVTNSRENNAQLDALSANPSFTVEVAVPPVIPDLTHDIVFVSDINPSSLLPNTFRDIKRYKDAGGSVILSAHQRMADIDFQQLIDFQIGKVENTATKICVDVINEFTSLVSNPSCFSSLSAFPLLSIASNSSVILASTEEGQDPLFVLQQNLFYYGVIDKFSGFKDQISYPLFWDAVINFLLGRQDLSTFNYKTGDILIGTNQSQKKTLEKAGFIESKQGTLAVNLLAAEESDLSRDSMLLDNSLYHETLEKVNVDFHLGMLLLLCAFALMLYELFYIKRRGDL